MSKLIGQSFGAELVSAACNNGVSYTVGGTDNDIQVGGIALANASGALADAVRVVVAAHDSTSGSVEAQRVAGIDAAIIADNTIQSLKTMTAPEFDAWWAANVTNLAQANNVLKRVTRLVIRKLL